MIESALRSSPATWEAERHKRGSIRWYPFDAIIQTAAASGGSAQSLGAPILAITTAGATATPQNRGREACEKMGLGGGIGGIWSGYDVSNAGNPVYWGRIHRMQCHAVWNGGAITPAGAFQRYGIYLRAPGVQLAPAPVWQDPCLFPFAVLYFEKDGVLGGGALRWRLATSVGDGVTATSFTTLVGVNAPTTTASAGGLKANRLELIHKPGEYVSALIDSVEGARHVQGTDAIPDPTFSDALTAGMAGVGVWLEGAQINDNMAAAFQNLMIETYRP